MITVLLEQIIQLLKGWIEKFNDHAEAVEDSLTDLNNTASDIELNTDPIPDIRDNTGAIITPITQIKTNTDSIKTDVTQIKTDTGIIKNNANSISTSAGAAAAFAEDCATNTLNIADKVTTIASDTTQLRADSGNIAADVSSINQALGYYLANTPVAEDSEGDICNFDTDMEDYLQALKVNIPADLSGFSGITLTKCGKNLAKNFYEYSSWKDDLVSVGDVPTSASNRGYVLKTVPGRTYSISFGFDSSNIPTYIYLCKSDGVTSRRIAYITSGTSIMNSTYTFTADSSLYYLRSGSMSSLANFNTQVGKISFCQFEESNEVTPYEAYKEMTYPVSFGSTITDGAEADLLSGLVKVNTTPESFIQIQPIAVRTYKGVNNIYSDVGTSALTYRETLKHYLDKNNQ